MLSSSEKIRIIKFYFRSLKGYEIRFGTTKDFENNYNGCYINKKSKGGTIFKYSGKKPEDYFLHEVLHFVLRKLSTMDRRKPKLIRQEEEIIIQDICSIFLKKKKIY